MFQADTQKHVYRSKGRRSLVLNFNKIILFFIFCLVIITPIANVIASELPPKFVMGTELEENTFLGLWERLIFIEAFKRLGVPLEVVVAPLKRIEIMLERGEIDGEMMRGPIYSSLHPKLVVVDFPITQAVYGIYALKPIPGLSSLDDLRLGKFRGAYRRGLLFCESTLSPLVPANRLNMVTSVKQGMDMLAVGHADFFCDVNLGVLNYQFTAPKSTTQIPKKLFEIGKPVSNSAYLHPKHMLFAVKLSAMLTKMEKEELFLKYKLDAMARFNPK
jgi:polar amino acid transport system substrate-binding protein